jgi:hypothetical protein
MAASHKLKAVIDHLTGQDKDAETNAKLPTFDELPPFRSYAGCAWNVWGPDDQLGTVNLLTEDVVSRAAQEEIKYVSSTAHLNGDVHCGIPGRGRPLV